MGLVDRWPRQSAVAISRWVQPIIRHTDKGGLEPSMMRVALIGDIHAYRLLVPPWRLVGKRLLGQANLWLNRRHRFDLTLLERLVEHVASIQPDMILMSGDLTTTALEGEFEDVGRVLEPLTRCVPTVAVPGNHDRYTFTSSRRRVMEATLPQMVPDRWPHFRRLTDRWHLLALDSGVPRLLNSRGRLGRDQLRHARRQVFDLTSEDGLIVLCHYPVKSPPRALPLTWDHRLADSFRLRGLLRRCSARVMYLHGHIHKPWCWQPKGVSDLTYLNAGSPCMTTTKHPQGQGYWQIDLPERPTDPVGVIHHLPRVNGQGGLGQNGHGWEARKIL